MKKEREELKEFVEGLEMTVLSEEDSILLDGMVGTSGMNIGCNIDVNCGKNGCHQDTNDHVLNCVASCGE